MGVSGWEEVSRTPTLLDFLSGDSEHLLLKVGLKMAQNEGISSYDPERGAQGLQLLGHASHGGASGSRPFGAPGMALRGSQAVGVLGLFCFARGD